MGFAIALTDEQWHPVADLLDPAGRRGGGGGGVGGGAGPRPPAGGPAPRGGEPIPSMVMIDAQTVKGGRYGPTFHNAGGRGGRTIGTKRTILVEILRLPLSARADPARPHDMRAGR